MKGTTKMKNVAGTRLLTYADLTIMRVDAINSVVRQYADEWDRRGIEWNDTVSTMLYTLVTDLFTLWYASPEVRKHDLAADAYAPYREAYDAWSQATTAAQDFCCRCEEFMPSGDACPCGKTAVCFICCEH